MGKIRTSWDLSLTLGIPFARWGASPFICFPVPFPADVMEDMAREKKEKTEVPWRRRHPLALAQMWCQEMGTDPKLNKAKIAVREGISRARVTQIMDLLKLPAEIQNCLVRQPAPLGIDSFSERRLRVLVRRGNEEAQMRRWQELLADPGVSAEEWTKI